MASSDNGRELATTRELATWPAQTPSVSWPLIARELAITGLRLLAASKNLVLAAERQGKNKTISQITAIIALLVTNSHADWPIVGQLFAYPLAGHAWAWWVAEASKWVAVALTALSGFLYLWKNRDVYLNDC